MIKIEHTLFALPFAFLGAVLAARGLPSAWQILWIVIAMVGARSAAMAFNRLVDEKIDAANPRTAMRAIPAGLLSTNFVALFTVASSALFFIAAFELNRLTLLLSPIALASVLLYSYTKRFTSLSHLVLGWCLSIAPTGAWIAVRGAIDSPVPVLLSVAVMFWTAGFDIIYACQDYEFDVKTGLKSIPQKMGVVKALVLSQVFHVFMLAALVSVFAINRLHWVAMIGLITTFGLIIYQHSIVKPKDLSRVNAAFFTTNAYISIILFLAVTTDILLLK